jgi:hypothetical protein
LLSHLESLYSLDVDQQVEDLRISVNVAILQLLTADQVLTTEDPATPGSIRVDCVEEEPVHVALSSCGASGDRLHLLKCEHRLRPGRSQSARVHRLLVAPLITIDSEAVEAVAVRVPLHTPVVGSGRTEVVRSRSAARDTRNDAKVYCFRAGRRGHVKNL